MGGEQGQESRCALTVHLMKPDGKLDDEMLHEISPEMEPFEHRVYILPSFIVQQHWSTNFWASLQ